MARFFVPADTWGSGQLPESEARHAAQVLRLGEGDKAVIFDGSGRRAEIELHDVCKKRTGFRVLREWREERPQPQIHLIVALIKNERFDWLVQKATELGAASIRPVAAERSVVKLDGKDLAKRRAKWEQTAVEAAKQCGHLVLPQLFPLSGASEAFRAAPEGLKGIPVLHPRGKTLGEFFAGDASNVTFAIGPEGDWTPEETAQAASAGFVPIHLGRHVLRSETAAWHVLSVAAHRYHGGVGGV
jgi:16S rRNA (uracil1498-N3)-methyltransferase